MQVLKCISPGKMAYEESPVPLMCEGNSILRIRRVGICGTDLHAFEGTQPYFSYPRVLGHELAAEIMETDNPAFHEKEMVTIIPYLHCGNCVACSSGKPNCCISLRVCGVHTDGGMAGFYSVPSNVLVHAQGLSADELALTEPLAIGAHAIRRAAIREKECVLIAGAGPIGLCVATFARLAGATVIIMDIRDSRLGFCREQSLAHHFINPSKENVSKRLQDITNGDMPAAVMDATGSQQVINELFQYLSHGGRYILVGLQKNDIHFSHPEFHKREATLMSSRNATRQDFEQVIYCIKEKLISPLPFITHRIPFAELKNRFPSLLDPATGVIKAMTDMD